MITDPSIRIDQKRSPANTDAERPVHTIGLDDAFALIRNQREAEIIGISETLMAALGLRADTDNLHRGVAERILPVSERAGLRGADGREIRRIEVKQHGAAFEQRFQVLGVAGLIRAFEIRCQVAFR